MKKSLLIFIFSFLICSSCFASGIGRIFSVEEAVADKFVASLLGNGSYSVIYDISSQSMKKDVNEKKFLNVRSDFLREFGSVDSFMLVGYRRNIKQSNNDLTDLIDYIVTSKKNNPAIIRVLLINENGTYRIHGFMINDVSNTSNR